MIPIVFTSLLNQYEASWETDDTLFNQPQDDLYSISQTPQVWLDHQVMERNGNCTLIGTWWNNCLNRR